jgi:transposase
MYERRSRLASYQQGELLKMFVVGATARAAAEVVGVHRNTAAGFFHAFTQAYSQYTTEL